MPKTSIAELEALSQIELAAFWGVNVRTVRRWQKEGAPVVDVSAMADWCLNQKQLPASVTERLEAEGVAQVESVAEDPEWEEFERHKAARKAAGKTSSDGATNTLEEHRDFYAFKLAKAAKRGKKDQSLFFTEQVIRFSRAIREEKLLAEKLGIQSGEMIPREDCERWFRAWGFWTMRGVDTMLADMVPRITGLNPAIDHAAARFAVEPALLEARMLRPYVMATKVPSKVALPAWLVAAVKDVVDDYLEGGAELFESEFSPATDLGTGPEPPTRAK